MERKVTQRRPLKNRGIRYNSVAVLAVGLTMVLSSFGAIADAISPAQQAAQQRVDALFSDGADTQLKAGERCLPARRIRSVDVLDSRTLVFDVGRNQNYLVRLQRQCFGLRKNTPITYEITGGRLCKLDGIRSLENWGGNRLVPGPRCTIPSFIEISQDELELVEARVDADKAARLAERKAAKAARKAAKQAQKQAAAGAENCAAENVIGG